MTNLKISEFDLREEEADDMVIIPCVHHKTGAQGMAQLAVTTDVEEVLIYYYEHIRVKIEPAEDGHRDNFFLTYNGGVYTQVYRKIKESLSVGKIQPPPPSEYRIVISSDSRRYLPEIERRNVVKHLSHTMKTSEQYYEIMNTKDATAAHATIKQLSLNRRWSKDEITSLTDHWPLSGSPPVFKDCKEYIKQLSMARDAKDVIYKWQQLKSQL